MIVWGILPTILARFMPPPRFAPLAFVAGLARARFSFDSARRLQGVECWHHLAASALKYIATGEFYALPAILI